VSEKAWGLVASASWCLQQIHEIGASDGASCKLIRCLQKKGVGVYNQRELMLPVSDDSQTIDLIE